MRRHGENILQSELDQDNEGAQRIIKHTEATGARFRVWYLVVLGMTSTRCKKQVAVPYMYKINFLEPQIYTSSLISIRLFQNSPHRLCLMLCLQRSEENEIYDNL